ncbi:reverse transcriptase-like protein [Bacillus horti]|uniref:Ribonuclease HI n=1 Tax=Caldalkalibacillus horti TaxID=77523 RepID=A0ABT9W2B9_9BACI|nr:reverse transcriptase-like protein [Bacillus horti]MDQ0167386.1 ribonuclease HI [Bacillus horti]
MIKVYIDGASAGDPGQSGAGIYINHGGGNVEHISRPLGLLTNHEAEFEALLIALKHGEERKWAIVSFHTDSQLVEQAVEKRFVKNKKYQPYLEEALELISHFDLFFIKWIPSKENQVADQLARDAIRLNL